MPFKPIRQTQSKEKPLCRLCQGRHWLREPHIFKVTEDTSPVHSASSGQVTESGWAKSKQKGRNSTVVSIRLPDSVYAILEEGAKSQSVSEYLRDKIVRSVNTTPSFVRSVNTTGVSPKIPGLIMEGNRIVGLDPACPKGVVRPIPSLAGYGTTLRKGVIEDRKGLRHEVELDADGQPVYQA